MPLSLSFQPFFLPEPQMGTDFLNKSFLELTVDDAVVANHADLVVVKDTDPLFDVLKVG